MFTSSIYYSHNLLLRDSLCVRFFINFLRFGQKMCHWELFIAMMWNGVCDVAIVTELIGSGSPPLCCSNLLMMRWMTVNERTLQQGLTCSLLSFSGNMLSSVFVGLWRLAAAHMLLYKWEENSSGLSHSVWPDLFVDWKNKKNYSKTKSWSNIHEVFICITQPQK